MTGSVEPQAFAGTGDLLKPYVPRLLIEWVQNSPETPHRQIDGSLAFVDISGFTALTERLARRGKVGAEILRDTLDGVFNALLDEAYLWGAGLIKWGGDAFLLLFDGPEHARRAARAAWEMQLTIERVGRLRVGGDTVTLRMSIGVTTGLIDFVTAESYSSSARSRPRRPRSRPSRTPARSGSVTRSLIRSTRRMSGHRKVALCCSLHPRKPSRIPHRTSGQ